METKEKKEQKEMEIKVFQKRANELKVQDGENGERRRSNA